jgi:hypothetical protein
VKVIKNKDREFRVAPARNGRPATFLWKFWKDGNEIYALVRRAGGGSAKFSVHASGLIHLTLEGKERQKLAPPLPLGHWLHAFEIRFLLSADAYQPSDAQLGTKTNSIIVDVGDGKVLILNLLVGTNSNISPRDFPDEFSGATIFWSTTLRNGRPVVLLGRVLEMNESHREQIRYERFIINAKATFSKPPKNPYLEMLRITWDKFGGNVIHVVPKGGEAIRIEGDASVNFSATNLPDCRSITISNPDAAFRIKAPNGSEVGTLTISSTAKQVDLIKNSTVRASLGRVTLSIDPSRLIFGQRFFTPPIMCRCVPTIDGAQPRVWEYTVLCFFDGTTLRAEIREMSCGLRNINLALPMKHVTSTEEIALTAPVKRLSVGATASEPRSSADLEAGLLLRDI